MDNVTQILQQIHSGQEQAQGRLLEAVYAELRQIAAAQMAQEKPGQTLQPTALVHEAWLRLMKPSSSQETSSVPFLAGEIGSNRRYFFAAAAQAMRRILVERARRKRRLKHGGSMKQQVYPVELAILPEPDQQLLGLDAALVRLAEVHPLKAQLVELRYFAGLSSEQIADVIGKTPVATRKMQSRAIAKLRKLLEETKS